MSEQPPPFPQSPIFNSTYFINDGTVINKAYLEANYLQFPTTQGTENFFYSTSFQAGATFSNSIPTTSVTQNYPSNLTTQLATVNYVNQAISQPLSLILSTQPASPYQINYLYSFVVVGNNGAGGGPPFTSAIEIYLPYAPGLIIPSGFQITIRNNTGFPGNNSLLIYFNINSGQSIVLNNGTNTSSLTTVSILNGYSTTFIFQATNGTGGGIWYVIGV